MKTIQSGPVFYVYEHWRPDKDVCFYVGKGYGKRAQKLRRKNNRHHCHIVAKLARLGMCVEVRMVASGLMESEALRIEVDRISFWRFAGIRLTNVTSGGEGVVGHRHSAETRAIIKAKRKAQKIIHSEETREKMRIAHKGRGAGIKKPAHSARLKGRKLSDEHKKAIGKSNKGRIVSPETRAKIGNKNKGLVRSEEIRKILSESHLGKTAPPSTRAKMTESHLKRWENPDLRLAVSSKVKALWATPEFRAKVAAARKARVPSS